MSNRCQGFYVEIQAFYFRAKEFLLLLHNVAFLAENQYIQISQSCIFNPYEHIYDLDIFECCKCILNVFDLHTETSIICYANALSLYWCKHRLQKQSYEQNRYHSSSNRHQLCYLNCGKQRVYGGTIHRYIKLKPNITKSMTYSRTNQ